MSAVELLQVIVDGNPEKVKSQLAHLYTYYKKYSPYNYNSYSLPVVQAHDFGYVASTVHCYFDQKIGDALFLSLALTLCMNELTINRVTVFFEVLGRYHQAESAAYFEGLLTFYQHLKALPTPSSGFLFAKSPITQSTELVKGWIGAIEKRILTDRLTPKAIEVFEAHCRENNTSFDAVLGVLKQHMPCLCQETNPKFYSEMRVQLSRTDAGHRTWVDMLMLGHFFNRLDAELPIAASSFHQIVTNNLSMGAPPSYLSKELLYHYFLSVFDKRNSFEVIEARLLTLFSSRFDIRPYVDNLKKRAETEKTNESIVRAIEKIFHVRLMPVSVAVPLASPKEAPPEIVYNIPTYHFRMDDNKAAPVKKLEGDSETIANRLIDAIKRDDEKQLKAWLSPMVLVSLDEIIVKKVLDHLKSRRPHQTIHSLVLNYFLNQSVWAFSLEVIIAQLRVLNVLVNAEHWDLREDLLERLKVDKHQESLLTYLSDSPYYCLAVALFFKKGWVAKDQLTALLGKEIPADQYLPKQSILTLQRQLEALYAASNGSAVYLENALRYQPEEGRSTGVLTLVQRLRQAVVSDAKENRSKTSAFENTINAVIKHFSAEAPILREKINKEHILYIYHLLSQAELSSGTVNYFLTEEERKSGWMFLSLFSLLDGEAYNRMCEVSHRFLKGSATWMFFNLTRPRQKEDILSLLYWAENEIITLNSNMILSALCAFDAPVDLNNNFILTAMISLMFFFEKRSSSNYCLMYELSNDRAFIHWFISSPSTVPYRYQRNLGQLTSLGVTAGFSRMVEEARSIKDALNKEEKNAGNLNIVAEKLMPTYGEAAWQALHKKMFLEGSLSCLLLNILMFDEASNTLGETEAVKRVREKIKSLPMPKATWDALKARVCPQDVPPSPRDAVLVLALASSMGEEVDMKAIVNRHLLNATFPDENKEVIRQEFIEALKLLGDEAFKSLKECLSGVLLLNKNSIDDRGRINKMMKDSLNDNPLLVVLRTGRSKYDIKDTKHYKKVRSVFAPELGSSPLSRLANFVTFPYKNSKDASKVKQVADEMYNSAMPDSKY